MLYQVSVSELRSIPKEITGPHYILQTQHNSGLREEDSKRKGRALNVGSEHLQLS